MMIKNLAALTVSIAIFCSTSIIETTYTMNAQVTNVNKEMVTVIDEAGETWDFYADEINVDDNIKLIFDNNHTHNRNDDMIKDYKIIK